MSEEPDTTMSRDFRVIPFSETIFSIVKTFHGSLQLAAMSQDVVIPCFRAPIDFAASKKKIISHIQREHRKCPLLVVLTVDS